MKKVLFAIVAILVFVPLLFAGAYFAGIIKTPQVLGVASQWGAVSQESTLVSTTVDVENPNAFGVNLGNVSADVGIDLNGVTVGHGTVEGLNLPAGRSTTSILTTIDNNEIPAWWASHINAKEQTQVRILPRATIRFLRDFTLSGPAITREFKTDLLAQASSAQPQRVNAGPLDVTLVRRSFTWGLVTPQATTIDGVLVLRNDGAFAIPLTQLSFTVVMNDVTVAKGNALKQPVVISPGEQREVPIEVSIDNIRLLDWWPTHVAADEVTQYSVHIDGVFEVTLPIVGQQRIPVPLMTFTDEFKTNVLGQPE